MCNRQFADDNGNLRLPFSETLQRLRTTLARQARWLGWGLSLLVAFASYGDERSPRSSVAPRVTPAASPRAMKDADDETLAALEAAANRCQSVDEAVRLYGEFRINRYFTRATREIYERKLAVWTQRADQRLVRMGQRWVTRDEAKRIAAVADTHLTRALDDIRSGHDAEARRSLIEASKKDPSGIRADFIHGLLNTPLGANHAKSALQFFQEALRRSPRNLPTINNLALVEVRLGQYDAALSHWERCLNLAPKCQEAVSNLNRFVSEARARKITPGPVLVNRSMRLMETAVKEGKGKKNDQESGWLYMGLVMSRDEADRSEVKLQTGSRILIDAGSAFAIAPDLLLTNHRVIDDADLIEAEVPGNNGQQTQPVEVVAIDPYLDLAVLRLTRGGMRPLALDPAVPAKNAEILASGFPETEELGMSLKALPGTVSAISDDRRTLLMGHAAFPATSGGAIVDLRGNVIALTQLSGGSESSRMYAGILTEPVLKFLEKSKVPVSAVRSTSQRSAKELEGRLAESSALLRCYKTSYQQNFANSSSQREARQQLIDTSCSACAGTGKVTCPARGCNEGKSTVRIPYQEVHGIGGGQHLVNRIRIEKVACKGCSGTGLVPCEFCRGYGNDRTVRRKGVNK